MQLESDRAFCPHYKEPALTVFTKSSINQTVSLRRQRLDAVLVGCRFRNCLPGFELMELDGAMHGVSESAA